MKYLKLYESFDDSLYSEISYNEYEVTSQNVDISFSSREVNKLKSLFKGWNMETKSGGKFMEFSNTTVKRNIFLKGNMLCKNKCLVYLQYIFFQKGVIICYG